jgi:DNA mismatch repair ATPase MutS
VQERLDAVEEMTAGRGNEVTKRLGDLLTGLPDLEKGLCRIQYGTVGPFITSMTLLSIFSA